MMIIMVTMMMIIKDVSVKLLDKDPCVIFLCIFNASSVSVFVKKYVIWLQISESYVYFFFKLKDRCLSFFLSCLCSVVFYDVLFVVVFYLLNVY